MHVKDFVGWNKIKQATNKANHIPSFKEREIWWCKVGVNIGHEVDGKNRFYNRPVLIVKKFNSRIFWGVALSTQTKTDRNYLPIDIQGEKQSVMLSHLRLYDANRLHSDVIGTLSPKQFRDVRSALVNLLQ